MMNFLLSFWLLKGYIYISSQSIINSDLVNHSHYFDTNNISQPNDFIVFDHPSERQYPKFSTIWDTGCTVTWLLDNHFSWNIELADGEFSQDFYLYKHILLSDTLQLDANLVSYTIENLIPSSYYRIRILPYIHSKGVGYPSDPLTLYTYHTPIPYWELLQSRRVSRTNIGGGYNYPVISRPHLDPSVEIYSENSSYNSIRSTDPPYHSTPSYPSGRQGHTMNTFGHIAYMYGGRTNGYSCTGNLKDMTNNGIDSDDNLPCTTQYGEVSELWTLDLRTYTWSLLPTYSEYDVWNTNTPRQTFSPPPRQQHLAFTINNVLYIYGGRTMKSTDTNVVDDGVNMIVYNDLWKLTLPTTTTVSYSWPEDYNSTLGNSNPLLIPQDRRLFIPITINNTQYTTIPGGIEVNDTHINELPIRHGTCIKKTVVEVSINHTCINQLKLSLSGPGPYTSSPNYYSSTLTTTSNTSSSTDPSSSSSFQLSEYEVLLYDQPYTNYSNGCLSGIQTFRLTDAAADSNVISFDTCCLDSYNNQVFQSIGRLSDFNDQNVNNIWNLIIEDHVADHHSGEVISWSIHFEIQECHPSYVWTNMTSIMVDNSIILPTARYASHSIQYNSYLYLMGGRDQYDSILTDLYRLNLHTFSWTMLAPSQFQTAWKLFSSYGSNFILTPAGLITYGGQLSTTSTNTNMESYNNKVYIMDIITETWHPIEDVYQIRPNTSDICEDIPNNSRNNPNTCTNMRQEISRKYRMPSHRTWASAVFIPSHDITFHTIFDEKYLYNQDYSLPSDELNQIGSLTDSILFYGGSDDTSGILSEGSSGGLLNDIWMLRLPHLSTQYSRKIQQDYITKHCTLRKLGLNNITDASFTQESSYMMDSEQNSPCLSSTPMTSCTFKDLLLLTWCNLYNQTV